MKIIEKLKHTITRPEAKTYIDQLGIELVIDTTEVNKELDRVNMLIRELGALGVKLHDVGEAKFASSPNGMDLLLIGECDNGLILVNKEGEAIVGQMSVNISSPNDDKVTATVEFVVGGIYKDSK